MTINDLCTTAHTAAVAKGFYERPRELPELLMLIVSELAEALESDRSDLHTDGDYATVWNDWVKDDGITEENASYFKACIKDTVEDEIADAFIRLADLCGYYGIDIDGHIRAKMKYNETRPRMHGKKY